MREHLAAVSHGDVKVRSIMPGQLFGEFPGDNANEKARQPIGFGTFTDHMPICGFHSRYAGRQQDPLVDP